MISAGASSLRTLLTALLIVGSAPVVAAPIDPLYGLTSSPDLAPLPAGGFVAIWHRDQVQPLPFGPDPCTPGALVGARLADAGEPLAAPREILLPGGGAGGLVHVAATSAGDLALAWDTAGALHAGPLTGDLEVPSSSVLAACGLRNHELVAAGDGYWAVWSEACDSLRVRARRLGPLAQPVGPVVEVADPLGQPGAGIAAAGAKDGSLFVAWVESAGDLGRRVLWSRFRADGSRATVPFPVSPAGDAPGLSLAAAALPDGGVAFAWSEGGSRILLRRFGPDIAPVGPIVQMAALAAEHEANPHLGVAPGGLLTVAWSRLLPQDARPRCPARVFDLELQPLTGDLALPASCQRPTDLAVATSGAVVASWDEDAGATGAICTRAEVGPPELGILPPPVPPIASPDFPDFRFRVRIGGDEPDPRVGAAEALCLHETICVSGALPGRAEVFLRVVGPKPNGFFWPTLVRFTTSMVEVWIDQVSSGRGRYYRLEGVAPGSGSLDGFFDRTGFPL